MDNGPDSLAMLLTSAILLCLVLYWWLPERSVARRVVGLVNVPVLLLFGLHNWLGLIDIPLDPRIIWPITKTFMTIVGIGVLGHAVRTFVTDYRRATAERLALERGETA